MAPCEQPEFKRAVRGLRIEIECAARSRSVNCVQVASTAVGAARVLYRIGMRSPRPFARSARLLCVGMSPNPSLSPVRCSKHLPNPALAQPRRDPFFTAVRIFPRLGARHRAAAVRARFGLPFFYYDIGEGS